MEVFYDPVTEQAPIVKAGRPPLDQTDLISQLNAQLTSKTERIALLEAALLKFKKRGQDKVASDQATVDGQQDIDEVEALGL